MQRATTSAHASQASCTHRSQRATFNVGSLRVITRNDPSVHSGIRNAITAALASPNSSVPTFLATPAFAKATRLLLCPREGCLDNGRSNKSPWRQAIFICDRRAPYACQRGSSRSMGTTDREMRSHPTSGRLIESARPSFVSTTGNPAD